MFQLLRMGKTGGIVRQPAGGGAEPRQEPQQRWHHLPRPPALLRDRLRHQHRRDGEHLNVRGQDR